MKKIEVGRINRLRILRMDSDCLILGVHEDDPASVFLPTNESALGLSLGDEIDVFVYSGTDESFLATTQTPKAMVGEIAYLKVLDLNQTGAFLDWGLSKDLLLPFGEQKESLSKGSFCTVFIHKDNYAERLVASQRLNRHIGKTPAKYQPGEEVAIHVVARTDLGYKVVVNHSHWGLLYENEVFTQLKRGMKTTAWVKKVVADDKVDLNLAPPKKERYSNASETILSELETEGGFLGLHDKSPPDAIRQRLGMSKKNFKAAVGQLYRQRQITIETDGIRLAKPPLVK